MVIKFLKSIMKLLEDTSLDREQAIKITRSDLGAEYVNLLRGASSKRIYLERAENIVQINYNRMHPKFRGEMSFDKFKNLFKNDFKV